MFVGVARLELYLPGKQSLKEKRMVIRSIKDKLRRRYNVSVSEVGENDKWQKAVIGISTVASEHGFADSVINNVVDYVRKSYEVDLVACETEVY